MSGQLAALREDAPKAAQKLTEFVVDNPVGVSVTVAGAVVVSRIGFNLVRPRSAAQGVALLVVLNILTPWLLKQAIERGVISFRLRDGEGGFVSARELMLSLREVDTGAPGPDPA